MVAEEDGKADGEHDGDEEEEEDVEARAVGQLLRPEADKVGQRHAAHEQAIHQSVEQEEQKEFVRRKRNAIVHPRTLRTRRTRRRESGMGEWRSGDDGGVGTTMA